MAKNGYRIFDSDTHVGPFMEVLEKYLGDREKARLAGCDDYVSKPFSPRDLLAKIRRYV